MLRLVEGGARAAIVSSVALAARLPVPAFADRTMGGVAAGLVRIYRACLSPWLGQQCLFHPTCSARALAFLSALGWNEGLKQTHAQLSRCRGNFTVRLTPDDRLELTAADGEVFAEAELAPHLVATYAPRNLEAAGFLTSPGAAAATGLAPPIDERG